MGLTGFRRRLVALAVLISTVAIVVLVVLSHVLLSRASEADATALARTRAESLRSNVAVSDGRVVLTEAGNEALDAVAWVYADGRLVDGIVPVPVEGQVRSLAATTRVRTEVVAGHLLYAEPAPVAAHHVVILVQVDLSAYESTERRALFISLVVGGAMIVLAGVVASLVAGRAMRVVHEMAALADDWGEHDPGRRFNLGEPRDEFGELARTLDHLLDRVEGVIADERRLTDEIAHELRTPLTALRGEAQLAALDGGTVSTDIVAREVDRLDTAVSAILATARQRVEGSARTNLLEALHSAVGDRVVETGPMSGITVAVPQDVLVRILSPVLDNAVRHATSRVWVTARSEAKGVVLQVFDDGSGFSAAEVERVFGAGVTSGDGHGLGLALVRRLAAAAEVEVRAVADGRGHVELLLPAAEPAT